MLDRAMRLLSLSSTPSSPSRSQNSNQAPRILLSERSYRGDRALSKGAVELMLSEIGYLLSSEASCSLYHQVVIMVPERRPAVARIILRRYLTPGGWGLFRILEASGEVYGPLMLGMRCSPTRGERWKLLFGRPLRQTTRPTCFGTNTMVASGEVCHEMLLLRSRVSLAYQAHPWVGVCLIHCFGCDNQPLKPEGQIYQNS